MRFVYAVFKLNLFVYFCFDTFFADFGANAFEQIKKLMPEFTKQPKVLDDLSLEGVAKFIKENKAKKIIVMTGAGVSTCKIFL